MDMQALFAPATGVGKPPWMVVDLTVLPDDPATLGFRPYDRTIPGRRHPGVFVDLAHHGRVRLLDRDSKTILAEYPIMDGEWLGEAAAAHLVGVIVVDMTGIGNADDLHAWLMDRHATAAVADLAVYADERGVTIVD